MRFLFVDQANHQPKMDRGDGMAEDEPDASQDSRLKTWAIGFKKIHMMDARTLRHLKILTSAWFHIFTDFFLLVPATKTYFFSFSSPGTFPSLQSHPLQHVSRNRRCCSDQALSVPF